MEHDNQMRRVVTAFQNNIKSGVLKRTVVSLHLHNCSRHMCRPLSTPDGGGMKTLNLMTDDNQM